MSVTKELIEDLRFLGGVFADMENNYAPMNEAYKEYFPTNPPARSCFPAGPFRRKESLLQVDAVAYVD